MDRKLPTRCPSCDEAMLVSELTCPSCDTTISGRFTTSPLLQLTPALLEFAEVFLRCRGNIREVERELGVSYPTVRSRLDEVISKLTDGRPSPLQDDSLGLDVIRQFEEGTLSFEETLEKIRKG